MKLGTVGLWSALWTNGQRHLPIVLRRVEFDLFAGFAHKKGLIEGVNTCGRGGRLNIAQYCFRSPQPVRSTSRVRPIQAKGRIVE